ncbi:hypothetical protein BGZ60DRAFT_349435, partial [Tricladium varicosporioides]
RLLLLLGLTSLSTAHFVLQYPISLGYDDAIENVFPCDGFNPANRSTGVTDWPIGGSAVLVLTTHPDVTWDINAALLSDLTTWRPIVPVLAQQGFGLFCEPQIPGPPEWVGQEAVLQLVQHAPNGLLYQCAAIRFVAGPAAAAPPECSNTTGTAAQWKPAVVASSSTVDITTTSSSS